MSTKIKIETLKKYIKELIKQELAEVSVTGAIDGGEGPPKTPYAFKKKKKKKDESINEAKFAVKFNIGTMGETAMIVIDAASEGAAKMLVAKQLRQGQKGIVSVKRVEAGKAKQVSQRLENVNEGRYHDYRNDESLSPKQKIGYSMREVRDKLNELDKLVKMNVRLKHEIGVDSTSYWKRTHTAMKKISERLVKLANKVGQLY